MNLAQRNSRCIPWNCRFWWSSK